MFPVWSCFKWKLQIVLYVSGVIVLESFFDSKSPQTPLSLISLKFFVTLRPLTLFYPKIRATKREERS